VSGTGRGPGPGPEPIGPRTSRWRDPDWWFGRSAAQLARREAAREEFRSARAELRQTWQESARVDPSARQASARSVGGRIGAIGWTLTIVVTLPIVATAYFGPIGLAVAIVIVVLLLAGRR
jgi:hypothetical protein